MCCRVHELTYVKRKRCGLKGEEGTTWEDWSVGLKCECVGVVCGLCLVHRPLRIVKNVVVYDRPQISTKASFEV